MHVKLGKYKNGWIGPYQIADWLKILRVREDRCDAIGDWLNNTWVNPFCEWIYKHNFFRHRQLKVHIDYWDTWSMDDTLAQIIAPMLRQLRKEKHGAPSVDDDDVPSYLRSTSAPAKENKYDTDENHFLRWDWVLDEMIWAFEQLEGDGDWESQYHTGELDIEWKKIDRLHPILDTDTKGFTYEMVPGPKDTHVFDKEGYNIHYKRMQNGYKLFGKYYTSLWD